MSHPIPGHNNIECSLCPFEAEDSVEVECGNNAENSIELNLCQKHLDQLDNDYKGFFDEFGLKIEHMSYERMIPNV